MEIAAGKRVDEPSYVRWLHGKCHALVRVKARKQTKHWRQYRKNLEWRIRTLFYDDTNHVEEYMGILKSYGLNPTEFCQN